MGLFADYEPERHGGPTPDGLVIRPAAAADVDALAVLRVERGDATLDTARSVFQRLLRRVAEDKACLLAAVLDGEVVAYGTVEHLTPGTIPSGWYLGGVVVASARRRQGIGSRLTRDRLAWIARRATRAYYFANARNRATVGLHEPHGFVEVERGVEVPGVTFEGGVGLLFAADLVPLPPRPSG
jgi:ribosomal protein S18 acetylase RimI-like enzyme